MIEGQPSAISSQQEIRQGRLEHRCPECGKLLGIEEHGVLEIQCTGGTRYHKPCRQLVKIEPQGGSGEGKKEI